MVRKMEEGYDRMKAVTAAYELTAIADVDRHLDHSGWFFTDWYC